MHTKRGKNKTFFHFKVFDKNTQEMKRFFTAKDVSIEYEISIPNIFKILKKGNEKSTKFNHLIIERDKHLA